MGWRSPLWGVTPRPEAALRHSLNEAQSWGEERFIAYVLHRLVTVYALSGRHEPPLATVEDVRARFVRLGIPRCEFRDLDDRLVLQRLLG